MEILIIRVEQIWKKKFWKIFFLKFILPLSLFPSICLLVRFAKILKDPYFCPSLSVGPICENPKGPLFLPEFVCWPDPKHCPYYCLRLFVCWPDPKDCPYYCLRLLARSEKDCHYYCLRLFACLSVVHPPSAQVLQSNLIKLGHMDHWGT